MRVRVRVRVRVGVRVRVRIGFRVGVGVRVRRDEPVGGVHALLRRLGVLLDVRVRVRVRVRVKVRVRVRVSRYLPSAPFALLGCSSLITHPGV